MTAEKNGQFGERARNTANSSLKADIRIEAVRVRGFRALSEVCVHLDAGTTLLVGENNTGKTAFLDAVATAMGDRYPVPDDLQIDPAGTHVGEFTVDVLILPTETGSFGNDLRALFGDVIRRASIGEYIAIRTVCSRGGDRSTLDRRRCFIEGWYGRHTPDGAEENEIAGQRVSNRHLAPISFSLLHADRDLVAEMQRVSSKWGRLLAQRDLPPETLGMIEGNLRDVSEHLVTNSPLLSRLSGQLKRVREAMPTVDTLELQPIPNRLDDLTKATDVLVGNPAGPTLPLRMQGLGSRSLAEIMVYQVFAAELPARAGEPLLAHTVSCFEEPEAHLHPHSQLAIMRLIDKMPGQRIVTTHSPHIASEADPAQIRLFRVSREAITVSQPKRLSREQTIKLRRLGERPYGQMFFARLVIVGDGATERSALPVFTEYLWGIPPEGLGVSFLDPNSLSQAIDMIGLLEDLGIPWLVFADGDQASHSALEGISRHIGRLVTPDSDEVVMLPEEQDFERYLLAEGFQSAIRSGIANYYGDNALTKFGKGAKHLADGDDLILGFLKTKKGTYGASVAEAIIQHEQRTGHGLPTLIEQLASRAARIIGLDSP